MALCGEGVERARLEREVEPVGAAVLVVVNAPPRAVAADPIFQKALAISPGLEWQRLEEPVAEADVHDPRPIERDDQHQVIAECRVSTRGAVHSARHVAHVEAHRREHTPKRAVHLVTPAAAPLVHELREHRCRIEASTGGPGECRGSRRESSADARDARPRASRALVRENRRSRCGRSSAEARRRTAGAWEARRCSRATGPHGTRASRSWESRFALLGLARFARSWGRRRSAAPQANGDVQLERGRTASGTSPESLERAEASDSHEREARVPRAASLARARALTPCRRAARIPMLCMMNA